MRIAALMVVALALGGCGGEAKIRTALNCPARAGDLVLTSARADGQACAYRGPDDSEVTLRMLPTPEGVPAALRPIEDEVWAGQRGKADVRVEATPGGGIAVSAQGEAPVVIPKASYPILRNDRDEIFVGPVRVGGGPGLAIISYERAVPLRGRASGSRPGMVRGLVHRGDGLPGGFRTLAYEAAGPTSGPMAVVVVRSGAALDDLPADARRLVRENGGL